MQINGQRIYIGLNTEKGKDDACYALPRQSLYTPKLFSFYKIYTYIDMKIYKNISFTYPQCYCLQSSIWAPVTKSQKRSEIYLINLC